MQLSKPLSALLLLPVLAALAVAQIQKPDMEGNKDIRAPLSKSSDSAPPQDQGKDNASKTESSPRPPMLRAKSKRLPRKRRTPTRATSTQPTVPAAVTLISRPPEYLTGEANVTVKGNENPIIRLGLARSGVTLVEFPASDRFFALHPGDSDMVTIDESPTKQNDHFFAFRAGSNFVPPLSSQTATGPSASIIAQMRSGMVVTFLIYSVRRLSQMAHRVVILYDRAEVVAARRAAGLAVNLEENKAPQAPRSIRIADSPDTAPATTEPSGAENAANVRPRTVERQRVNGSYDSDDARATAPLPNSSGESVDSGTKAGSGSDLEAQARKALKLAITSSKFKKWTRPNHGLSLAASNPRDLSDKDGSAIVIVAVSNILPEPLRIVAGQPDLSIETRDEQGKKTLLAEQLKPLHVESSGIGNSIPAGSTLYYAIIYRRPVLGVNQRLRVTVGQINAADDPAVTDLPTSSR